jgi:serine/threonine-protein kinase
MTDDRRLEQLLDALLNSQATPEEVCATCPELLPQVRARWQKLCRLWADLDALFPTSPAQGGIPPAAPEGTALPEVPGHEVRGVLGRGGMGVVYLARHLRLNRPVALKMLLAGAYAEPADRERFQREAEAVAALSHPNVVQVHEVGDVGGRPYFTMELVEGGDLAGQIQGVPQPARQAAALVATLAEAVHAAHQSGIVHRDLKPSNILLARDGTPKVTDFGLARRLEGEAGLTLSGTPMGTPSYMAPEQARGDKRALGPATDIWALGTILYELLTGRPPFRAESGAATLQQVLSEDPVPPARLNSRVPRDRETICLKCLRKEPERRYASARELADDLGRFGRGEPVVARPLRAAERLRKWVRRRPAAAGLLAAVALLVAAGAVGAWLLYQQRAAAHARQALTDEKARGILERARDLLAEGWRAADLAKLTQARTEANRAVDIARSGAGAAVQQEAEQVRGEVAGRLQRLEKDRALLAAVQDVVSLHETFVNLRGSWRQAVVLAQPSADEQYAAAFRRWGLDVDKTLEAEVVARLGAEPDPVVQELVGALDEWMMERRLWKRPEAQWRRLFRVAERLDRSDRRRQLRATLAGRAPPRADSLTGLIGAGSPWTAVWELELGCGWRSLLELQGKVDPRTEPALTVVLLGYALDAVGDTARAEQLLRQAATARPEQAVLLGALGKIVERQGPSRLAEAIGYYRAARSRAPHQGLALSKALLAAGKAGEAEEVLRELARQRAHDHNPAVPLLLGSALLKQRRYGEAEAASREAIRRRPDWTQAYVTLGAALLGQQKYGPAEAAFRQALALQPDWAEALFNLGAALSPQRKYEKAEAACRQALALQPGSAAAFTTLGAVLLQQGKLGKAEAAFRKAIAVEPGQFKAHYHLGTALIAQGRSREAEPALRKALALKPEDSEAHNNLGVSLLDQKQYGAAEAAFRKALALKPEYGPAYRNLGYALMRHARFDEAAAALKKVGALVPAESRVGKHARQLERQCERYVALDARFPAILRGAEKLAGAVEQLHFAHLCFFKKRYAAAARFWQAAFAADPKLAEGVPESRYDAATAAALAGSGHGQDAAGLDDTDRARWRRQALAWLRQELARWDRALHRANAKIRVWIQQLMQYWQTDDDLAGLREPGALAKLAPDERQECRALWEEVAALIRRAQTTR